MTVDTFIFNFKQHNLSSPEPEAQMNFSDHNLSVVRQHRCCCCCGRKLDAKP